MRHVLVALAAMILASCASIQGITPKTPREALAAAEVTFTGTLVTVSQLHGQGILTDEHLRTIVPKLERANEMIRASAAIILAAPDPNSSDVQKAVAVLHAAIAILYEVSGEARRAFDEAPPAPPAGRVEAQWVTQ